MADTPQDVIHVVDVDRVRFATGDGRSRLFQLNDGDGRVLIPTVIRQVFIGDWMGDMSPAYPFPRTNYIPYAWDMRPGRWTALYGQNVAQWLPAVAAPSGITGRVTGIRLGDCVYGPGSNAGGFYSVLPDPLPVDTGVVFSVWMRASVPLTVNLSSTEDAFNAVQGMTSVGTEWAMYWVDATTVGKTEAQRRNAGAVILSQANNVGVDPNAVLQVVYAQTEVDLFAGQPSRLIPTNGVAATFTDYVVNNGNILSTDPVPNGAPLYWTGTGYWLESPANFDVITVNTTGAVTWRYDQSPNLLSLLRAKQRWYDSNHASFWRGWTASIFDLKNANVFGVAVWAFILNVPLTVLSLRERYRYWAFGPTRENFTDSDEPLNPSSGNFPPLSQSGAISTPAEKIQALRLKYYALTSDCTITSLNKMLADVFEVEGLAYVEDNEDMTMTYVFTFPVSSGFQQSMLDYGLLPKPAGVKIIISAP